MRGGFRPGDQELPEISHVTGGGCRLLHVQRDVVDQSEIIRVAAEYNCLYASNRDFSTDSAGEGKLVGSLSPGLQKWLKDSRGALHVHYTFDARGAFSLQVPPFGQQPQGCPAICDETMQQHIPSTFSKCTDLMRLPVVADFVVPSVVFDTCVVAVQRGLRSESLLCIRCDDPGGDLFKLANTFVFDLLGIGTDCLHETDRFDPELEVVLAGRGGFWASDHLLILMAMSGPHAGLRAVGLGSNLKKRRRAAHLALAATAALHSDTDDATGHSTPSELVELVKVARHALNMLTHEDLREG